MRSGSIQLFRVFGIRIGADVSWFLVLFLFIFSLSGPFQDTLGGSNTKAYLTAVASVLLFFLSVIFHELGHALVARRLGYETSGIDLWLFGGMARVAEARTPGDEAKIAGAGPAVTLAFVGLCVLAGIALGGAPDFWDAVTLQSGAHITPGVLLLSWVASWNAFLFVFNLVPAFPLDGGRLARAAAWKITGDRMRATRFAATLGRAFSYVLIGLGFYALLRGAVVTGIWSIFLGMMLGSAARGAIIQTAVSDHIGSVTVADIMDREPVAIEGDTPVAQAVDEYFLRYRWPWFPVVDRTGRFVGLVRQARAEEAERAGDQTIKVRDVMDLDAADWRVPETASLEALLGSEPLRRFGALVAVDDGGILRGVVTIDQLRRALQSATAPPAV